MNAALLLINAVTCLLASNLLPVYGQAATCCQNCCDVTCSAPTPYNISLDEFAAGSPMYINFFPADPVFGGTDNICYSFEPLPDGSYLLSVSEVFSSGYNASEFLIMTQTSPGVFNVGGKCYATITIFDYVQTCDCYLYLAYICYDSGSCLLQPMNAIPVFGFSSYCTPISQNCLNTSETLISIYGVPDQSYLIAPFQQPTQCFTYCNCTNSCC